MRNGCGSRALGTDRILSSGLDRNPQYPPVDGRQNQSRTREDFSRAAPLYQRAIALNVGNSHRSADRARKRATSGTMKNLFGETTIRVLAFGALLLALILAVVVIRILLVPFVAALFVVYLFDPAILFLERHGIQPSTAFLVLLGLSLIALGIILALMPGLPLEY